MSDIDKLHESLFGYIPTKAGTAYERIGAVVLATLGWSDVVHDTREMPAGRLASHQLDIVARDPSGDVRRLLVECKDWDNEVGQGTLNALVGVRDQVGADAAAVVTTEGFKRGALNVAIDEDIALVRLAAYDPVKHGTNFVKRVSITVTPLAPPERRDFGYEIVHDAHGRTQVTIPPMTGADYLLLADGSPAERIQDVVKRNASPSQEGVFKQRAELPPGRFVPTLDGKPAELRALIWTETNRSMGSTEIVQQAKGEPVLFLEELDESGEGQSGRLLVSDDLFAWDIDSHGNVVPRGNLGPQESG